MRREYRSQTRFQVRKDKSIRPRTGSSSVITYHEIKEFIFSVYRTLQEKRKSCHKVVNRSMKFYII